MEMSAREVFNALEHMADLRMDMDQLDLIRPMAEKIKAAIRRDDAEAVAQYATKSVADELAKAGYTGVLTPRGLREHVRSSGWSLIMDVVSRRENAATVLKAKIDSIQGASQFAGQHGTAAPAPPPAREQPSMTTPSPQPPARAAMQSQYRSEGPSTAPSAMERHSSPAPARSSYTTSQRAAAPQRGPSIQPPAPQRTAAGENVRSITTAPVRGVQQPPPPGDDRARNFDKVKVHGGSAALTIEACETSRDEPTISIEAAKMLDRASRTYDWSNKIIFQLTVAELQHVTALFHGYIDHLSFKNHGREKDKWFEIERQTGQYAGTFKVKVGQGSNLCVTQITSADIGNVSSLFRRRCAQQMRETLASLKDALEPVARAYNEARAAREAAGGSTNVHGGTGGQHDRVSSAAAGGGYRRQTGRG